MFLAETSGSTDFWSQYGMIIILAVFFVVMIVMTIIPQRKQKKQQQQMMDSLAPGAKIMTIGGFVGTIVGFEDQNILVDIGTKECPQVVVIVRNAVRQRLDVVAPQAQPAKKEEEKANEEYTIPQPTAEQIDEMKAETIVENAETVEDVPAEEEKVTKKSKKTKKESK